ncbi:MAG TPA: hypothetical protein VFC46_06875 [Humisphaera sp.]|nr:hypothetical protein [Humisphaera sp.]
MLQTKTNIFLGPPIERLESRALLSASFKVVDVSLLSGGIASAAYGLNQAGVVVGNADAAKGIMPGFKFANAVISALGTLPGATTAHAYSVNSQVDVTGEILVGKSDHAYLFSKGVMHDLGTLGGSSSFAYSINDSDTIVGGSFIRGDKLVHAFEWTPISGMKDIGTLGGGFSLAYAITAAGKVAGYSTNSHGQNHAFLYDGKIHDLGTLSGATRSVAYAINATGQIAGSATVKNNEHAVLYSGGKFSDLGTLGGISSWAYGINRSATIVGVSTIKGSSTTHAFEYRAGKMYDLNSLIDPASGWTLLAASAVNDAGQIVGVGMIRGHVHGFLLNPVNA